MKCSAGTRNMVDMSSKAEAGRTHLQSFSHDGVAPMQTLRAWAAACDVSETLPQGLDGWWQVMLVHLADRNKSLEVCND